MAAVLIECFVVNAVG